MPIEKQPFVNYKTEEEKEKDTTDIVKVRLNPEERADLDRAKKKIEQIKDSTALKQLAQLGMNVVHDKKISDYMDILLGNRRRNKRTGINDFD